MMLYSVFDIRLLWNADQKFLGQFEPKVKKIPQIMKNGVNLRSLEKTVSERGVERSTMQSEQTFVPKKNEHQMNISFILPQNMELESFPADELCKFIKMHTDGAAEDVSNTLNSMRNELNSKIMNKIILSFLFQVKVYDTFYHPSMEAHTLSVRVVYRLGQKKSKREIKNIHESVRAQAAHNFDLTLRL